jgi:hypothetical protein
MRNCWSMSRSQLREGSRWRWQYWALQYCVHQTWSVLLHYDSSKHCVCSLYKFVYCFKVVKLFLKHPIHWEVSPPNHPTAELSKTTNCYLMTLSIPRPCSIDNTHIMIHECGVVGGMRICRWNRSTSGNTRPIGTFSTTNPTRPDLGSNSGGENRNNFVINNAK